MRKVSFAAAAACLAIACSGGGDDPPPTPSVTETPALSPGGGTYSAPQSVTITCATAGATIHYTTDGSTPTASSPAYSAAVAVSATTTLKALATSSGRSDSAVATATYTMVAATPTFTPAGGTYASAQSVAITTATPGATIHYTTDGTTPTTASPAYAAPLNVSANTTVRAVAVRSGFSDSAAAIASYVIEASGQQAATPTFSPLGGTYTTPQLVTISTTSAGATIHYTTDGTTPTTGSPVYAGPVAIAATTTLQAFAVATGFTPSNVASATYTINLPETATPTFSPPGGTYTAAQSVTIACATPDAWIWYTTDGSDPMFSDSRTRYLAPILVSSTTTLRVIAFVANHQASASVSATYTINIPRAATPTFSPPGGTYPGPQSVTLATTTAGTTIHYTTDGSTPTIGSPSYAGAIQVASSMTLRAIAVGPNVLESDVGTATYTIDPPDAAKPTFSPPGGVYLGVQSVTISSATVGATIHYTTDWTTPTTSSPIYTGPVEVASSMTLHAIAVAPGHDPSPEGFATYVLLLPKAATPTFDPPEGAYAGPQSVTISTTTAGATIHYTTDGSVPTSSSPVYSEPILVSSGTTLQAIAVAAGYEQSDVGSASYAIGPLAAATPTFDPPEGRYASAQSVTISTATPDATIHYTTDGSAPTTASPAYTAPIEVSTTTTVRAIATAPGFTPSDVAIATYTIDLPQAATPVFTPGGGSYGLAQHVAISTSTPGATIHFTTDGSDPTTGSAVYSAPIAVSVTTTLRAIAVAPAFTASAIASATYTIDLPQAATPTFDPGAGNYATAQSVMISTPTPGATIHYTSDGSNPTAASPTYGAPIQVSATTTLRAIATAPGFRDSAVGVAAYVISTGGPPDLASYCSGFYQGLFDGFARCAHANIAVFARYTQAFCDEFQREIDAGRATYDASKAQACLDAIAAASCASFATEDMPPECAGVITGNVQNGESCYAKVDCANGFCGGDICPGVCTAYTPSGSACDPFDNHCDTGLYCAPDEQVGNTCTPRGALGDLCVSSSSCRDGLYCDTSNAEEPPTCAAKRTSGSCATAGLGDECAFGYVCAGDPGNCVPLVGEGGSCALGPEVCGSGWICLSEVCTAPPGVGSPCAGIYFCVNGYCDYSAATPTCTAYKALGAACTADFQCDSGACSAVGPAAGVCIVAHCLAQ